MADGVILEFKVNSRKMQRFLFYSNDCCRDDGETGDAGNGIKFQLSSSGSSQIDLPAFDTEYQSTMNDDLSFKVK